MSSSSTKTSIVIISKSGSLSECVVETKTETTIDELTILLSKKCGFRNPDGFSCYHTWRYKNKSSSSPASASKYIYVDIWAKTDGRAGQENKYELPPPIDELLIFGNMALVARIDKENAMNLTVELWNKIYEALFGGFEDLTSTAHDDENESDELDSVPACKKTNSGYLKDGFVVEDDSEDTPRCKRKASARIRGKKSKSESTESEFITETETDTLPSDSPSDSPMNSDTDSEPVIAKAAAIITPVVLVVKTKRQSIKKPAGPKSKKTVDEPVVEQESESELSEDSYS